MRCGDPTLTTQFFTVSYLAAIFVLRENGMGFSGKTLTITKMENLIKATLAIQILYYLLIYSIKISILFVYMRIGKTPGHLE